MVKKHSPSPDRRASHHGFNLRLKKLGRFWHDLGPGLTTGAADDDPSGIATYSQAGSRFGFRYLWLALFTFPFMAIIQEICARIGLVTGRGLAANIRLHFPRWVLYLCTLLLFCANTFNIGADLGAMAKAVELLSPQLQYGLLLIGFTFITLLLEIFTPYRKYSKYLKVLSLVLLAYVLAALTLKGVSWDDVFRHTFVPTLHFSRDDVILLCGILGTTISPYLFFWQTSQEVEEEILTGQTTIKARSQENNWPEIRKMRRDVWIGMLFSNLIMFFIILTAGAVLHPVGILDIKTAAEAAAVLKPLAGNAASALFALGVVGVGLLAVPILAGSAAYALSESFRWREGLYRKFKNAYAFYTVIIVSIGIGFLLNVFGLDPIKGLIYSAIGNGLVAPVVLVCIMLLSTRRKFMGEYINSRPVSILGWLITVLMAVVALVTLFAIFS